MIGEYHLTLPPNTHPLDGRRRAERARWWRDALEEARSDLGRAKRAWLLRRALTLKLWK